MVLHKHDQVPRIILESVSYQYKNMKENLLHAYLSYLSILKLKVLQYQFKLKKAVSFDRVAVKIFIHWSG